MRSTIESDAKAYLGVESPLTIGLNAGNVRRPGGSKVYVVTTAAVTVGKTRANGISSTPPSLVAPIIGRHALVQSRPRWRDEPHQDDHGADDAFHDDLPIVPNS